MESSRKHTEIFSFDTLNELGCWIPEYPDMERDTERIRRQKCREFSTINRTHTLKQPQPHDLSFIDNHLLSFNSPPLKSFRTTSLALRVLVPLVLFVLTRSAE
jgi:hypothetical protein